jgi:hypothetical protein
MRAMAPSTFVVICPAHRRRTEARDHHDMQMQKVKGDAMMVKGEMLTADAIRKMFKELYPGN